MKTAMQFLIDELDLQKIVDRDKLIMVQHIITQALEKEKENIVTSWNDSKVSMMSGEQYFNETFDNIQNGYMMTPKEKANELYNKFYNTDFHGNSIKIRDLLTKECALIAVDEIIIGYEFDSLDIEHKRIIDNINYWDKVKQEIENL